MPFKPPCERGISCYWQGISTCCAIHTIKELSNKRFPIFAKRANVKQADCEREFIANDDGSKRSIVAMRARNGKKITGQGELI